MKPYHARRGFLSSLVSCVIFALFTPQVSHGFVVSAGLSAHYASGDLRPQLEQKCPQRRVQVVCWARSRSNQSPRKRLDERWFPRELIVDLESGCEDEDEENSIREEYEAKSLRLMATLISGKLDGGVGVDEKEGAEPLCSESKAASRARGRFVDLCCTPQGERLLEALFEVEDVTTEDMHIVQGAIISLQSLLILGTQFGVTATEEQFEKSVSHLIEPWDDLNANIDHSKWDSSSTRKLKYISDRTPGLQILAEVNKKRSAQGAYDLLVKLGAWQKHEDLALLRSGFSLRFGIDEMKSAEEASNNIRDPDTMLGIRKDLRDQKVFTIDSASTSEIDDGLAVEVVNRESGSNRYRYWIHIADADQWAPRDSKLFQIARKRSTSLYLPQGAIPMLPSKISSETMSLKANEDAFALSLGLELAEDGSIIDSSIVVFASKVRVSYRLTYDEVDEMLEDGVAYNEEWQLGALLSAASVRRKHRIENGSSEAFVPNQIPQFNIATFPDRSAPDGIGMTVNIQVSNNGGKNQSAVAESGESQNSDSYESPVSAASTLVTEMMILAGEAMGKWKLHVDSGFPVKPDEVLNSSNSLRLPFRSQPKPDYRSREREQSIMEDLLSHNVGDGYCHAWYARRFFARVKVDENANPHSGLGLDCYAQWTSPIRRFGDLQVHCAVKRYLRRQKVFELIKAGLPSPKDLHSVDLGCDASALLVSHVDGPSDGVETAFDIDIDYSQRAGLLGAARILQRSSERYWMLEFIRRLKDESPGKKFEVLVLGCTNPTRRQYAIYIYELGLEWKYVSPVGSLQAGTKLKLRVASVLPRNGQLTFTRVNL